MRGVPYRLIWLEPFSLTELRRGNPAPGVGGVTQKSSAHPETWNLVVASPIATPLK